MRSIGIVRKVDELGRIVIPKELCRAYQINPGTPMEIFVNGNDIILRKYQPGCTFCGGMRNLKPFGGQQVCADCREVIRKDLR